MKREKLVYVGDIWIVDTLSGRFKVKITKCDKHTMEYYPSYAEFQILSPSKNQPDGSHCIGFKFVKLIKKGEYK
jgi:hypothetical protein